MKKIIFIFFISLFSFAKVSAPIKFAARTNLKKGILLFGIKNLTNIDVAGIAYVEKAEGIELLSTDIGFALKPFEVKYYELPVRNAVKDLPRLKCKSIIFNDKNSKLYSFDVKCKSGAKFRSVGAQENVDFSGSFGKITDNNLTFTFNNTLIIKKLNFYFGGKKIKFKKNKKPNSYTGTLILKTKPTAKINLNILFNNRDACIFVAEYSLLENICGSVKAPELDITIPKKLLKDDLLALKYAGGEIKLHQVEEAKLNEDVEELYLITETGRLIFVFDSSYCVSITKESDDFITLKIKSRVKWQPPYPPRRAGTIFLPVIVSLAK